MKTGAKTQFIQQGGIRGIHHGDAQAGCRFLDRTDQMLLHQLHRHEPPKRVIQRARGQLHRRHPIPLTEKFQQGRLGKDAHPNQNTAKPPAFTSLAVQSLVQIFGRDYLRLNQLMPDQIPIHPFPPTSFWEPLPAFTY